MYTFLLNTVLNFKCRVQARGSVILKEFRLNYKMFALIYSKNVLVYYLSSDGGQTVAHQTILQKKI